MAKKLTVHYKSKVADAHGKRLCGTKRGYHTEDDSGKGITCKSCKKVLKKGSRNI